MSEMVELNSLKKANIMKDGRIVLTPMLNILLNKRMPRGFKLESDENMLKAFETIRPAVKKQKIYHKELGYSKDAEDSKRKRTKIQDDITSKENSSLSGINKKRSERTKKPIIHEDLGYVEKDKLKGAKNPVLNEITKKCDKAFQKIKKHPFSDMFYSPISQDAPSLSQVEKNVKSFLYTNIYQFVNDIRKIINYFFSKFTNNPEMSKNIAQMTAFTEEILQELTVSGEEKSDVTELAKQVNKLSQEMKEMKNQPMQAIGKKQDKLSGSVLDKPLSISEKNLLGQNIRLLTTDQLKGVIGILSDSLVIDATSRYFEFDIETLSTRKLRELEKYVKGCLKQKTSQPKQAEPVKQQGNRKAPAEEVMINQLKNDLAFKNNKNLADNSNTNSVPPTKKPTPVVNKKEIKENRNILSESDDSLSSSEESDSDSLSSLDLKK